MSTTMLFRADPYLGEATGRVAAVSQSGGIVPDVSVFYPTGGGQPGDSGAIDWEGGTVDIATTAKGEGDSVVLVPEAGQDLPPVSAEITMRIDWERRYGLMRVHTALHLLSVALPFGVTGGSISPAHGRLDFDMAEPPDDKAALAAAINDMIATDAPVSDYWISDAELDAQPELVKTMKVKPPRGTGKVRLVRIGSSNGPLDLQPCGGTHVARLGEIGSVRIGKTEKKGRMNRRVYLHLVE